MNSILKKLILRYKCKELYNLQLYYERSVNDLKGSVVKGVNEIRRDNVEAVDEIGRKLWKNLVQRIDGK